MWWIKERLPPYPPMWQNINCQESLWRLCALWINENAPESGIFSTLEILQFLLIFFIRLHTMYEIHTLLLSYSYQNTLRLLNYGLKRWLCPKILQFLSISSPNIVKKWSSLIQRLSFATITAKWYIGSLPDSLKSLFSLR